MWYYALFLNEGSHLNRSKTFASLGFLLTLTIGLTIFDSYVPHEFTLERQLLSVTLLILMLMIGILTLRSILQDF